MAMSKQEYILVFKLFRWATDKLSSLPFYKRPRWKNIEGIIFSGVFWKITARPSMFPISQWVNYLAQLRNTEFSKIGGNETEINKNSREAYLGLNYYNVEDT